MCFVLLQEWKDFISEDKDVCQATFLDDACSIEHAQQHGHTHILEVYVCLMFDIHSYIWTSTVIILHFKGNSGKNNKHLV